MPNSDDPDDPLEHWFASGGDHRLLPDDQGLTPYRVGLRPRDTAPFGSCTASSPGPRGWKAAEADLKDWRSGTSTPADWTARNHQSLRSTLELPDDVAVAFAPSGTDVLYLVSQIALRGVSSVHHVVVGASELGGGTMSACKGLAFSPMSPFGGEDTVGRAIPDLADRCSAEGVYLRDPAGTRRKLDAIDAAVEARVDAMVHQDKRIVLHMVVHSKTGLRAPSTAMATRLLDRHGDRLLVLVDAAQGRLAPADIRGALACGFAVLFTGSKFYSGPPFSGALFLPPSLSEDPGPLVKDLCRWFDRASLPAHWRQARASLSAEVNAGLALRWTAALAEITAYHEIPPRWRGRVYATYAGAIHETFGPSDVIDLEIPLPPGHELVTVLGAFPTVFGFRVRGPDGWFDAAQLKVLHRLLDTSMGAENPRLAGCFHLGQPVALGPPGEARRGILRVALGARLVTDFARSPDAGGAWMRDQMARIRTKIETLVQTGRVS